MDKVLFKKINLLLHLAKADGKFDKSEKKLLISLLKEKQLDEHYLETHQQEDLDLNGITELPDQTELFYWILKMIKADDFLHPIETALAKVLALKLNFKPETVDYYVEREIPDWRDFENEVSNFRMIEANS